MLLRVAIRGECSAVVVVLMKTRSTFAFLLRFLAFNLFASIAPLLSAHADSTSDVLALDIVAPLAAEPCLCVIFSPGDPVSFAWYYDGVIKQTPIVMCAPISTISAFQRDGFVDVLTSCEAATR